LLINKVIKNISYNIESIISILSRVINASSFYILTYISSRNLTSGDFAMWTLFITFINLLPIFNFGISTGLVNKMAYNNSLLELKDKENSNLMNASFKLQFLITFVFIILILISNTFKSEINNSNLNVIFDNKISIIILLLSLPFQFYSSLLFSYKQINLSNYLSIIQNIILLTGSYFTYLNSKNINTYIFNYSIIYTILLLIFFIIAIIKNKIIIGITLKDIKYIYGIFNSSFSFWIMSLFSNLLSTAQIFFVTFFFGLKSVPNFFIFQRLFSIINTFHLAFLSPYTIKFIELAANNNWNTLKVLIFNLTMKFTTILYLTFGLLIFIEHPLILKFWVNTNLNDYLIAFIFLLISFITSIGNVYSVLLNSLGHFKVQILYSSFSFISFFFFLVIFKNLFGPISIAISTIPASLITIFLMRKYTNSLFIKNEIIF
jgi:O-antigen/teichoic acid export membrane protein